MDQVSPSVVWSQVRTNFNDLLAAKENLPEGIETDFDAILAGGEGDLDAARTYATRLSATLSTAPQGHVFFNGKHFDLDDVRQPFWSLLYETLTAQRCRPSCKLSRWNSARSFNTCSTRSVICVLLRPHVHRLITAVHLDIQERAHGGTSRGHVNVLLRPADDS